MPGFARASALQRTALPLLAAVALAAAGCGGGWQTAAPGAASPVVATWSGHQLSLDAFEQAYAEADGLVQTTPETVAERRRDFLERYVNFRLKVLAAREAGYDQDEAYRQEIEGYRDQLAGPYFTDKQILDDIVRDLYEKRKEEIEVSHLLLALPPDAPPADTLAALARANEIREAILAGTYTFEEAARRYSQDPSAASNGGALGYITGGRTVLAFENAAYGTPVGQISAPARSQYGYHLVYVTDRRPAQGEIRAAHILIRPQSPDEREEARERAEALRARILAGEDFAALARQYSEDPGSATRGGDLGFFGTGRMVRPFEEAAFALREPGDVSPVVETSFGFHLIQLTERRALPAFDESYDQLRQLAQQLPRTALKRDRLGRALREEAGGTFDEAALRAILAPYAENLGPSLRDESFAADADRPIATIGPATYTFGQLLPVLRRTSARPGVTPDQVVATTERYLNEEAVAQAVRQLEHRDPEFRRVFQSYADGVLLFRVAEDSVWTPAKDDEAALRAFHAERRAAYRWPERRRVLALRTPSDSLLQALSAQLDAGAHPRALFERYRDARFALALDTVFVAEATTTPLDAVLSLQPGQHTGVLPERNRLAIFYLDGLEAPREKTFAEARAELITAYQDVLERAWEARLRARYNARTFPERVPAEPPPGRPAQTPTVARR
ncbi:MAG: peptidylprolyl isomerase [Rubricoccaceae bacterium]